MAIYQGLKRAPGFDSQPSGAMVLYPHLAHPAETHQEHLVLLLAILQEQLGLRCPIFAMKQFDQATIVQCDRWLDAHRLTEYK